jgi:hypothetical protein
MPTVCISVDCEAAHVGKCYTRELVRVAEEFTAPLTWLIFVSEKDALSNVDLYHSEYLHRIPAWHEIGLLLSFENSNGYISDPDERGDAIRIGKDTVKSRHIKPTAFRAHRADMLPSDLKHLEDIGILVDGSACPSGRTKHEVTWPDGPTQPYHPSYQNLSAEGDAKLLMLPIASDNGLCGYLDFGWEKLRPILQHSLARGNVTHLAMSDHVSNAETLRKVLSHCRGKGARIATLTQAASEIG